MRPFWLVLTLSVLRSLTISCGARVASMVASIALSLNDASAIKFFKVSGSNMACVFLS